MRDYLLMGDTDEEAYTFEREILRAYEKEVLVSARPSKAELAAFRKAARGTS
jgi:hypothetical protein